MNVPIATPITIAPPPRRAMRVPRQSIGRREKRALNMPTINSEKTDRKIDTMSAVLAVNSMYGTRGTRDASTQEINIRIAEITEGRALTLEWLTYSSADSSERKSPIAIENAS